MDTGIGTRLDEAMYEARVKSQSELSRRSGIPQSTINRILKGEGKRGPDTATLAPLARALGVELMWLQHGSGPKAVGQPGPEQANGAPAVNGALQIAAAEPPPQRFLRYWLTDEEAEIVALYRSLTPDGRKLTRLFVNRQKRDDASVAVDES